MISRGGNKIADKNFTITNRRGIEVPVPEWLYNINNINGVVVKLPTYELAHIIVPLNSAAQDKVLEALPPRSVSDEFVQTETTQSGIEVKMKVYVCFFHEIFSDEIANLNIEGDVDAQYKAFVEMVFGKVAEREKEN